METGDNVLIQYNPKLSKLATVLEVTEKGILLFDTSGKFILTHDFIRRSNIQVTEV
jgi:hypothetical protein